MNWRILLLAFAPFLVSACQRQQPTLATQEPSPAVESVQPADKAPGPVSASDLDRILNNLHDDDEKVREAAKGDLFQLGIKHKTLTVTQGVKALRAAAQPYPFKKPTRDEVCENLVQLADNQPQPEYIPVVVELFDKFSDSGRWPALGILASLEDRAAAVAYMEIVRQHAKAGRVPHLVTRPLEQKPRHADVFFPELLEYASIPSLSADVYRLCLAYAEAELLPANKLAPFTQQVLTAYRQLADKLRPAQRAEGVAWMWEENYHQWRSNAGLLLDLLGHFPGEPVEADLRGALEYRDPHLQYFAISSLLHLGKPVDAKVIAAVAAQPEMRNWLYKICSHFNKLALYPEKYRTQAALAESDMVEWLTFPTELGRVPDEIELMKVISVDTELPAGVYDYYLFRFRTHEPHWAAEKGWTAGVSGPFRRKDSPTTQALGDTFSTFTKWASKKPDEHVGDTRKLMERWREYHQKNQE